MLNLIKFKNDIQNLLKDKYSALPISKDEVAYITSRNLKTFPSERFNDYLIFYIKGMKYIIGFDVAYNVAIFYTDGTFIEGWHQMSNIDMVIKEKEKIDLMSIRQKALYEMVEGFKKYIKYNNIE